MKHAKPDDVADSAFGKRLAIALAASLAIHEALAGAWPAGVEQKPDERVVTQVVSLLHRAAPTPRPTPRVTPAPTPRITPAPHYTLAPHIAVRAPAPKAAATPQKRSGGEAARKHVAVPAPHAIHARSQTVSLAEGVHAGRQNGGGGTGAGSGAGTGGQGGTGSGTGGTGNGTGSDVNAAPCGEVYILPGTVNYRSDGTVVQEALAKLVLRDGTVQVAKFPYPFVYPRDADNPFKYDAATSRDGGIPVQQPPPGEDVASMPAAVQIVLKHTDPVTGFTNLPECQKPAPP